MRGLYVLPRKNRKYYRFSGNKGNESYKVSL